MYITVEKYTRAQQNLLNLKAFIQEINYHSMVLQLVCGKEKGYKDEGLFVQVKQKESCYTPLNTGQPLASHRLVSYARALSTVC